MSDLGNRPERDLGGGESTTSSTPEAALTRHLDSHCKDQGGHTGRPLHQRVRPHNPQQHLPCAGFGPPHGGRTLARGAMHFARPYRDAVAHAERHEFEPKVTPIRFTSRTVEARLTIEAVEIGADELAVLYAKTSIVDEIGHAARGVDLIVRAVQGARFRLDNLDAVLDRFL